MKASTMATSPTAHRMPETVKATLRTLRKSMLTFPRISQIFPPRFKMRTTMKIRDSAPRIQYSVSLFMLTMCLLRALNAEPLHLAALHEFVGGSRADGHREQVDHDAQAQGHRKAADRAGAEQEQEDRTDLGGDVGVDEGGK